MRSPREPDPGSGKMKTDLREVRGEAKGRNCFHELRWDRHSQALQRAVRAG